MVETKPLSIFYFVDVVTIEREIYRVSKWQTSILQLETGTRNSPTCNNNK